MCQTSLRECFSRPVRWQQSPKEGATVIKIRAVGDAQRTLYSHVTSSTVRCALVLWEKLSALSFSSLQVRGAGLAVPCRRVPFSWHW